MGTIGPNKPFPLHSGQLADLEQLGEGMRPSGRKRADYHASAFAVYPWLEIIARLQEIKETTVPHRTFVYRHAETEFNAANLITGQTDVELTESGREAARQFRRYVPTQFDSVYCSALKRAQETARLALAAYGFFTRQCVIEPRFNEVALGRLEGKKRRHISAFAEGDIDFAPPGGESYRSAAQRVFSAFIDLCERAATRNYVSTDLIFAHAGVMRILATLVLGIEDSVDMFRLKFSDQIGLEIRNKAIKVPEFWYAP
jgi:broad specificity phosphatase PhoE